ncbi:MAG: VOC family protein [Verrucomicrobia bacterium]|nr:VOC family protein [Verrucomicrobiota bacterium]
MNAEAPAAELSVLLLLTRDPDRTAAFYRDVLGLPLAAERHDGRQTHYAGRLGGLYLTIQSSADLGEPPERGHDSMQLCFTVPDMDAFLKQLDTLGLKPLHPPRRFEETTFVTVLDPDRRHIRVMLPWGRG